MTLEDKKSIAIIITFLKADAIRFWILVYFSFLAINTLPWRSKNCFLKSFHYTPKHGFYDKSYSIIVELDPLFMPCLIFFLVMDTIVVV
jgi:hypothetical protein